MGHSASRGSVSRDAGKRGQHMGSPRKYGTVGNPTAALNLTFLRPSTLQLQATLYHSFGLSTDLRNYKLYLPRETYALNLNFLCFPFSHSHPEVSHRWDLSCNRSSYCTNSSYLIREYNCDSTMI